MESTFPVDSQSNMSNLNFSDFLYYDESSPSCLRWRITFGNGQNKRTENEPAGSLDKKGYFRVQLKGKKYACHRIVYKLFNSTFNMDDELVINHINLKPSCNQISNLELVTQKVNQLKSSKQLKHNCGVYQVIFNKVNYYACCIYHEKEAVKKKCKYFSIKSMVLLKHSHWRTSFERNLYNGFPKRFR